MKKVIKEVSNYAAYDEKGMLLKGNFKDLEDALEYGVNALLTKPDLKKVVLKAEITITKL